MMSYLLSANPDVLFTLWRNWQSQSTWAALDRWLKRELAGRSDALVLGTAMHQAMRFLQLASALEHAYRMDSVDVDWCSWDAQWQPRTAAIPPLAFWYWVSLRLAASSEPVTTPKPPPGLRDAAARQAFFARCHASLPLDDAAILQPLSMLWFGMRPSWADVLHSRQRASGWSDAQLAAFVRLQLVSPPLWLRVAPGCPPGEIAAELKAEGVQVALSDAGLCARGGTDVTRTLAYREGRIDIQDLASQQLAAAVAAGPGQKVWDACAGAGGKSLAVAALMHNKGMLLATDLHAYKLEELKRRAKRAGLFNIRSFAWAGDAPLRLPQEAARQRGFDWVLVDAPCSSSGTWRRNPDARWRFSPADTAELVTLQARLLTHAAPAVKPGGYLVYGTCSWQVEENEAQVADFLARHPDFALREQHCLGAPAQDSDCLFAAVLARRG